jgi:phosphoglycerate dehydrogenase-like enzyme
MTEPSLRVLVAGAPYGYQQPLPDGRWLAPEHEAAIRGVSPRVELVHVGPPDLDAGFTLDPAAEVIFSETSGFDPSLDVLPNVLTARHFARLVSPRLRWVQSASSGVEHILPGLDESVLLTNASGVHADAIGESVLGAVLFHSRRLRDRLELQERRLYEALQCTEVGGKTICVVGTGDIGSGVARRAGAFGMRVVGVRRTPKPTEHFERVVGASEIRQVLPEADYLVIACPLTPETEGLIGSAEFEALKPGAYLINVARGLNVDEAALLDALERGRLGGAFLDAHVREPLPPEHPLWRAPGATIISHDSHSSERIGDNMIALFCDNLGRYVRGEPLRNVIDRGLGY